MSVLVHRASGLLEPFEVPELTIEAAIDRGWQLTSYGLMRTSEPVYLPVQPRPGFMLTCREAQFAAAIDYLLGPWF